MNPEPAQIIITEELKSGKDIVYANKNEAVTLITDSHFPVLLCMRQNGESFPVHYSKTNYKINSNGD